MMEAELQPPLSGLRKDAAHPLQQYLFRPAGTVSEPRLVAIVGGRSELATNRLQPEFATRAERKFVCFERQPEPDPPHADHRWHSTATLDDTVAYIEGGRFDAVHLSTPPEVTGRLLGLLTHAPMRLVTAEKPWFNNLAEAEKFFWVGETSETIQGLSPLRLRAPPARCDDSLAHRQHIALLNIQALLLYDHETPALGR
jgi:hypothetical protein